MKTPMNEPITMFKKQFNFLSIAVPPSKIPIYQIRIPVNFSLDAARF